jgi:hypothetical protein
VIAPARKTIDAWLQKRFALRVHMSVILVATFLVGLISTRLLLDLRVTSMWLRYMLSVLFAYGGFLLLIKSWLFYLGLCARRDRAHSALDLGDFGNAFCNLGSSPLDFSFGAGSSDTDFGAGGGSFGGGGASGSWGTPDPVIAIPKGSGGSGVGDGVGKIFDGFDLDEGWVIVLLIVVVLAIFSAGIYLIWAAPAIFGETAFHAALATALIKKTKNMHEPGWMGSVMKATAIPFGIVLVLTIALGVVAHKHCPSAIRLRDALTCGRR